MEQNPFVENIMHRGVLCAVVLRAQKVKDFGNSEVKTDFFTPSDFSFQVGLQKRNKGEQVLAHFHKAMANVASLPVQEILYVLSGKVLVDLYHAEDSTQANTKIAEVVLQAGDSIILNTGHGVTFLEDTQFINIKQGPYRGRDQEKIFVDSK